MTGQTLRYVCDWRVSVDDEAIILPAIAAELPWIQVQASETHDAFPDIRPGRVRCTIAVVDQALDEQIMAIPGVSRFAPDGEPDW